MQQIGRRQAAILDVLADGPLVYEVLVRRVPGPRRAVLKSVSRMEACGLVTVARGQRRMQAGDLVMLATPQPAARRAHDDVQAVAAG